MFWGLKRQRPVERHGESLCNSHWNHVFTCLSSARDLSLCLNSTDTDPPHLPVHSVIVQSFWPLFLQSWILLTWQTPPPPPHFHKKCLLWLVSVPHQPIRLCIREDASQPLVYLKIQNESNWRKSNYNCSCDITIMTWSLPQDELSGPMDHHVWLGSSVLMTLHKTD